MNAYVIMITGFLDLGRVSSDAHSFYCKYRADTCSCGVHALQRRDRNLSTVVETVTEIVKPILDTHNFYLTDLEFTKEGSGWYLRVYIDKQGGITIEDCVVVNDELSEALDNVEPDPIPQAYFLEVSSPGAERPLKTDEDMKNAVGEYIHISLFQKQDAKKVYEGTLKELNDDTLVLVVKDKSRRKEVTFNRKNIAKARLAIEF
jgi:ribosome maturation factor RimP